MDINRNLSMDFDDDVNNQRDDDDVGGEVNVIAVRLDAFASALIEIESDHFQMAHYINECPIIVDHFNELLGILFKLFPSMKWLVTQDYIVECMFDHENYSFAEIMLIYREGITNKQRNAMLTPKSTDNCENK
jgi:hypothetical protein